MPPLSLGRAVLRSPAFGPEGHADPAVLDDELGDGRIAHPLPYVDEATFPPNSLFHEAFPAMLKAVGKEAYFQSLIQELTFDYKHFVISGRQTEGEIEKIKRSSSGGGFCGKCALDEKRKPFNQ